jgi:hypothetical protein
VTVPATTLATEQSDAPSLDVDVSPSRRASAETEVPGGGARIGGGLRAAAHVRGRRLGRCAACGRGAVRSLGGVVTSTSSAAGSVSPVVPALSSICVGTDSSTHPLGRERCLAMDRKA